MLIPRPETELIIDRVVEAVESSPHRDALQQGTWVDMGTGSGAIALGLAEAFLQQQILLPSIKVLTPWPWPGKMPVPMIWENRITLLSGKLV